jgi:hypothetical protein
MIGSITRRARAVREAVDAGAAMLPLATAESLNPVEGRRLAFGSGEGSRRDQLWEKGLTRAPLALMGAMVEMLSGSTSSTRCVTTDQVRSRMFRPRLCFRLPFIVFTSLLILPLRRWAPSSRRRVIAHVRQASDRLDPGVAGGVHRRLGDRPAARLAEHLGQEHQQGRHGEEAQPGPGLVPAFGAARPLRPLHSPALSLQVGSIEFGPTLPPGLQVTFARRGLPVLGPLDPVLVETHITSETRQARGRQVEWEVARAPAAGAGSNR